MKIFTLLLSVIFTGIVYTQVSINDFTTNVNVEFSSFTGSGFSPSPGPGMLSSNEWEVLGSSDGNLLFGDTQTGGQFARGVSNGGVTTGGIYAFNYGTGIAFGFQATGTAFTPGAFTLKLQNNTGAPIQDLTLSYEIWVLNDQNRSNSFNFEHGNDNINFQQEGTLNFVSEAPADPSPAWELVPRNITLENVYIADGDFYFLRWTTNDVGGSGSRDEFGVNNIIIGATELTNLPNLTVTPLVLTGFEQFLGAPSVEQNFTIEGVNLIDSVVIAASSDYEISLSPAGSYSSQLTLQPSAGVLTNTPVYVRLNGSVVNTNVPGTVTFNSNLSNTNPLQLEGEIFPPLPALTFSTNALSGFLQEVGSPSTEQSFEVSGEFLIDDITLTAPTDYEIAELATGPYTNQLTLTQNGGEVMPTTIYVRLNGTTINPNVTGDIAVSTNGIPDEFVSLNGEIVPPTPLINTTVSLLSGFVHEVGSPSPEQTFEVSAFNLVDDLELEIIGEYEISLTSGGGFTQSFSLTPSNGEITSTTIYVRLNGATVANPSNGEVLLTSLNALTVGVGLEGQTNPACNLNTNVVLDNFVLTAAQAGVSYQWVDCDNDFAHITNETTQFFVPSQNGNYAVILTDGLCVDTSACVLVQGLSVKEQPMSVIQIYPNPAKTKFTLKGSELNQFNNIQVFDITGRLVYSNLLHATGSVLEISCSDWNKGLYILQMNGKDRSLTKRIIVE
ncbi:MAG: T9SS type A sorting domain-containing protein [Crocinitomicaceae bacterium]|nr:T9SS type A sorting domain-containing protein [Crocinitomicaceae bacterium]